MELIKTYHRAPSMKSIQVYEQLKSELITGKWEFSEKILVNNLIERFNMSRRPIMDALKMLENDGFIQIIPQSGCKVIDFSKQDIIDHILIANAMETLCVAQATINHTDEELESLRQYQKLIKKNQKNLTDILSYLKYNREFHYHLSMMSRSVKIRNSCMQMWDLSEFYLTRLFGQSRFNTMVRIHEHDEIIKAIQSRDPVKAKKVMEEHVLNYVNELMELLPEAY